MNEVVKTERHHYVPRCYLKNFSLDKESNRIYAYQRNAPIVKTNIANIATKKNLYTLLNDATGEKTNFLEDMFGMIESVASPVINKIVKKEKLTLDDEERIAFAQFIAFLATRTIAFETFQRNMMTGMLKQLTIDMARDKDHLKASFEKAGIKLKSEKEFEDVRESILDFDEHFKIASKGGKGYFFNTAIELSQGLAPIIFNKHWHLLISKGSRVFITSDNPVVVQRAKDAPRMFDSGFMFAPILLPLSPSLCLLMRNKQLEEEIIHVKREQIDSINRSIMFRSDKFIYSNISSKDLKTTYDRAPEGSSKKAIIKKIRNTPYIMATSPEPDLETIE